MSALKDKLTDYVRTRGLGYILTIPVILLAAVAIVLYNLNGKNIYSPDYSDAVYIFIALGMALALASMLVSLIPAKWADELARPVRCVAYLLFLYAVLRYVYTQITFLGAVFAAIDVEQYSPLIPGFAATITVMLATALLALVATILDSWRPWARADKAADAVKEGEDE